MFQCDQIGAFCKVLVAKFRTKEAQVIVNLWGNLINVSVYVKTIVATFWATWIKILGYFCLPAFGHTVLYYKVIDSGDRQETLCVQILMDGVPPKLSGFICAYHPATLGSNPKHTIYTFINLNCDILKRPKYSDKEAGICPFRRTEREREQMCKCAKRKKWTRIER